MSDAPFTPAHRETLDLWAQSEQMSELHQAIRAALAEIARLQAELNDSEKRKQEYLEVIERQAIRLHSLHMKS